MRYSVRQAVFFPSGIAGLRIFSHELLKEVSGVEKADFSRVIVEKLQVVNVNSERGDLYSIHVNNDKLVKHVSELRDPDGVLCLAMAEPEMGYDPKSVIPSRDAELPLDAELPDSERVKCGPDDTYVIDTTSVLFSRLKGHYKGPMRLTEEDYEKIVQDHLSDDVVIDLKTDPLVLSLKNHTNTHRPDGIVSVTLLLRFALVPSRS
jgi:hypothetical protein